MQTKAQKTKAIEEGLKDLKNSESVVFADFTGLKVNDLNAFRKSLKSIGIVFKIVKKRLLKIIFEQEGLEFDGKKFDGQTGVMLSPKDFVETAGVAFKFSRGKETFKLLGGFDLAKKEFFDGPTVKRIGQLPSREVLLGALLGMLTVPVKKFMYVLNEKAKKVAN